MAYFNTQALFFNNESENFNVKDFAPKITQLNYSYVVFSRLVRQTKVGH